MHKRVCSEDPSIKPHVPIEMAVERVLKRKPSQETAPADATCYICLDHDSKLMRGCACRGDSAGFVHLECLIELAERDEEGSTKGHSFNFNFCINCKQAFTGALRLQLARRFWRRHRDESVESRRVESSEWLGDLLRRNDEEDAANLLSDAVSNSSHLSGVCLELKMASRIAEERPEEALKLLEGVMSQAKQDRNTGLILLAQNKYMPEAMRLGRYEETAAMATESLESLKTSCGDYPDALTIAWKHDALEMLGYACGMAGRFDESKRAFDELLASATRIFGYDHEDTRSFFENRAILLRKMVSKARDLVSCGDLANGVRYLDAVLIESKARDCFDAKDPDVQINCETMAMAADVSGMIGRLQESVALARLCLKSARNCMWNYAKADYDLHHGPTKESKRVLDELLAIQTRLYGPDGPATRETGSFLAFLILVLVQRPFSMKEDRT